MRLLIAALLLAGAAAPAAAAPQERQPRDCIANRDIKAKRMSADTGYFVQTRQGWWRNSAGACAALRPDAAAVTVSNSDRQCSGDLVQFVNPFSRIAYGGCPLRNWEPVAGPPEGVPAR